MHMEFRSERTALTIVSDTIIKAGVSLYNAVKYIYSLADEDFYNCNIKDVFKVVLNNITDTNCLQSMGLRINNYKCVEMNTPEYDRVLSLMVYSFAVRIPTLRRVTVKGDALDDNQMKALYELVLSKGAANYQEVISEDYETIRKLVRSGKPVPEYSAEWYKLYIYTSVPALSTISNKNLFLLGFVDILFTLFYTCLEEELEKQLKGFAL